MAFFPTRLAIIVPYRNREEHLAQFVPHMDKFLSNKKIDYKIFVVEQGDDRPFNRGWLINIGYEISSQQGFDYFCFHDIDMLPEDETCDYSWVDRPTHLAARLSKFKYRLVYPEYFGGVTMFNKENFKWINGFSNKYWGWGFEDDDLLYRCRRRGVPLTEQWVGSSEDRTPRYINCMEFNGQDYLEIKSSPSMDEATRSSFSMEVWVEPTGDLELNPNKAYDEFHIFTRPGHHVGIAYTSGLQYKGSIWNSNGLQYMTLSDRFSGGWTHVIYTVDDNLKTIRMFVNGKEISNSRVKYFDGLRRPVRSSYFIGCANPHIRTIDRGFFTGVLGQATLWSTCLNPKEVGFLYNKGYPVDVMKDREFEGWKQGTEEYKSAKSVVGSWDFNDIDTSLAKENLVLDRSGNNNHAKIHGAVRKEKELRIGGTSLIPNRRDGKFTCLEHEENGWAQTKFTHWQTRENQLRFFNQVRRGLVDIMDDGLNTLEYKIVKTQKILDKHEFITVIS